MAKAKAEPLAAGRLPTAKLQSRRAAETIKQRTGAEPVPSGRAASAPSLQTGNLPERPEVPQRRQRGGAEPRGRSPRPNRRP